MNTIPLSQEEKRILQLEQLENKVISGGQIKESRNIVDFTPAQDFHDQTAYTAVPLVEWEGSSRKNDMHVITSDRIKILLNEEKLFALGMHPIRKPSLDESRWSQSSVEEYISGRIKGDFEAVYKRIRSLYAIYIDFGDERWVDVLTCWCIGTYFHRLFVSYPYIHLNGTMESGKSKTLLLTSLIAFNGEMTSNSTPPYTIRTIHDNHATCCIDEIENISKANDDSRSIIGMYNSGYTRGTFVGKAEQIGVGKDNRWVPKRFESYSPKIFASINGLEASLVSRCIPLMMTRSNDKEIKNREISIQDPKYREVRDELYPVMLDLFHDVRGTYQGMTDNEILGREWELWRPILSIAAMVDPKAETYQSLRAFAIEIGRQKKETVLDSQVTPKLLHRVEEMIIECVEPENFYSAQSIVNRLQAVDEEMFGWLAQGKNPTRWLGNELRKSGVVKGKASQKKVDGKNTKGYYLDIDTVRKRMEAYE